jgi:hypothetical protein
MLSRFEDVDIAKLIQVSVAPVFLLAGMGAIISVLSVRVGRIVDRARELERQLESLDKAFHASVIEELKSLAHRSKIVGWSISLCTISELLICALIALHFIGGLLKYDISLVIAILFIISMLFLIAGLILFLREIFLSMASTRTAIEKIYIGRQGYK